MTAQQNCTKQKSTTQIHKTDATKNCANIFTKLNKNKLHDKPNRPTKLLKKKWTKFTRCNNNKKCTTNTAQQTKLHATILPNKQHPKQQKQNTTQQNKTKRTKRTKQNKTKQNKTKQSKAKQSKTKQNNTKQKCTKSNQAYSASEQVRVVLLWW